jgi:hypothetical protein
MEISLAIIGTAGRKEDAPKLSKDSFGAMCIVAKELLAQLKGNNYEITHLVSGGAAWADHVAVKLFLNKEVKNLRLYIPCQFDNGSFFDGYSRIKGGGVSDKFLPGQTLNYYHGKFQKKTGINSLTEIQLAIHEGAEVLPCKGGFHGRNAMVAKSDILLAMTFGNENVVKEGGTADTVRKYLQRAEKEEFFSKTFHYNLNNGKIYSNIDVPEKNNP